MVVPSWADSRLQCCRWSWTQWRLWTQWREAAVIARIQCTAVEGDLGPSTAVGLGLSSGGFGPSEGRLLLTPGPSAVEGDLGPSASVVLELSGDFGPSRGCSRTQWREAAVDQVDGGCAVTTLEPAIDKIFGVLFSIRIKTVFQDLAPAPFSSSGELVGFCEIRIDPGCSTCCER